MAIALDIDRRLFVLVEEIGIAAEVGVDIFELGIDARGDPDFGAGTEVIAVALFREGSDFAGFLVVIVSDIGIVAQVEFAIGIAALCIN